MKKLFSQPKAVAIAGILVGSLLFIVVGPTSEPTPGRAAPSYAWSEGRLWHLEVADTDSERLLGLGERDRLAARQAMLFLFEHPDYHGFWMKGMRFPLDMVFLRAGSVVSVERGIAPDDTRIARPTGPADQVIEMNAGEAAGIDPGDLFFYW
jgi:uncharacterized membrane protein (UPF0127 family)